MDPGRGLAGAAAGGDCGAGDDHGTSAVPSRCAGCSGARGLGRSWRPLREVDGRARIGRWGGPAAGRWGGMAGLTLPGDRV